MCVFAAHIGVEWWTNYGIKYNLKCAVVNHVIKVLCLNIMWVKVELKCGVLKSIQAKSNWIKIICVYSQELKAAKVCKVKIIIK